jgi:hypothetical protein
VWQVTDSPFQQWTEYDCGQSDTSHQENGMPARTSLAASVVLVACVTLQAGQTQSVSSSFSDLARTLIANRAVQRVPLDETLKLSIATNPTTYVLPGGKSSALLLELPDYQTPYVMTISSIRNGIGRTSEMFIPSGTLSNADLASVGELTEQQLQSRVESVAAQLVFDDRRKDARYVLLYTHGDRIGQPVDFRGQDVISDGVLRLFRVQRSLNAKIEVSIKFRSGYDRMRESTPVETVREFIDQSTVVRVPPLGKVRHTIAPDAPTFSMNGAPTSAVLVELPEFRTPYSLVIESQIGDGLFVPSGLFFDGDLNAKGRLTEREFAGRRDIKAQVQIGEEHRSTRYLLLFTQADLVGFGLPRDGSRGIFFVPRSIEGKLEIEAARLK